MSWTKKITDARKILKTDDTVSAIVLELDKENRRISLGMKQMEPNPWLSIEDHYPIGTVITRKVKSLTAFGAFVEIEEGIDGLIHISDISWTKRIYHPREVFRKNQEVEAIVLSIDRALHRIALGVKQLHIDPWQELDRKLPVNTEVIGKVSKLIPKGVLVDVTVGEDVVEGFVPISHLAIPKLERSEDAFFVGEDVPLKVIELDMKTAVSSFRCELLLLTRATPAGRIHCPARKLHAGTHRQNEQEKARKRKPGEGTQRKDQTGN
jgi:small subunit ribosomal protein S1